jgi:hypothetical protein
MLFMRMLAQVEHTAGAEHGPGQRRAVSSAGGQVRASSRPAVSPPGLGDIRVPERLPRGTA